MRIAVAVVVVIFLTAWGQLVQELGEVLLQRRVVVFLHQNSRGGMWGEHVAHPTLNSGLCDQFLNEFGDVPELDTCTRLNLGRAGPSFRLFNYQLACFRCHKPSFLAGTRLTRDTRERLEITKRQS